MLACRHTPNPTAAPSCVGNIGGTKDFVEDYLRKLKYEVPPPRAASRHACAHASLDAAAHAFLVCFARMQFSWGADDSLSYWKTFPAYQNHPVSGKPLWFNQASTSCTTTYAMATAAATYTKRAVSLALAGGCISAFAGSRHARPRTNDASSCDCSADPCTPLDVLPLTPCVCAHERGAAALVPGRRRIWRWHANRDRSHKCNSQGNLPPPPPQSPARPHEYTRTRTRMPARTESLTHADADGADRSGVCGALSLRKPFAQRPSWDVFWLQVVWQNSYAVPMEPGDLLVCDNYQAMHGRMSFGDGESRKVFVSATYD